MKKSTLISTLLLTFGFVFFGCSEKSVTYSEPKKEKSIEERLAEDLLTEFQDNLSSWNACIVYNGVEYTSLDDFLDK